MGRRPIYKMKTSSCKVRLSFFYCRFFFCYFLRSPAPQKITRFSGDSTKFITELNSIFAPLVANEAKMSAALMKSFIQKWNAEKYDPSKKKLIYAVGNQMLKKGLKPYPDFYNYIKALNVFIDSYQPDERFI